MRLRSFVSSAAVIGTLLASSALVSDAMAQKGQMMRPSTAWAVAKVDNSAAPYCTMARQFNRNTVLTFAQNEDSETSLALDFQRPAFQAGSQVSVILDPGAGQQRAYQTTPVSNKAFVVRLGRDDSFFNALSRTGLLRVEVGNQSFHFNVSDIDKGQSNLDSCVANMIMPAAGDEGPLTPGAPVVADAGASYRSEINGLRGQISRLKSENESLKIQMQTRTDSAAETSGSVAQLAAQIRQLEDENATLKSQAQLANAAATSVEASAEDSVEIAELRAENVRLKAELQTVQPQEETLVGLETEIQALKAQNEKLEMAANEQSDDSAQVAALQEQLAGLKEKNAELNTRLSAVKQDVKGEYEAQIAALNDENAALKSTMGKKGVDAELLEQLRQQIAQAENENRLLQETAAQAQKNLEEQLKQDNLLALESARAEQANKITQLEEELTNLRAENFVKAEELVSMGEDTSSLQALQEENETLKNQLAAMETQRGQTETLVERIANLEAENEDLQKQLIGAPPITGEDSSEELLALQGENAALKKQVADGEVQTAKIAALEEQVSALKTENEEMQALANEDSVKQQLDTALNANEALSALIKDKDEQLLELETLRGELAALKDNAPDLQQVEELQTQHDEMKTALADVVAVAERYKQKNAQQEEQIATLQSSQSALEEEIQLAAQQVQEEVSPEPVIETPVETPEVQPVSAPAEPKPQPLLEEASAASVQVPTPQRKPQIAARAEEPVVFEPPVQETAVLPEPVSAPKDIPDDRYAALEELQKQMRNTHVNDQRRMQQLAREYMALKSEVEREEYAAAPEAVVETISEEKPLLSQPTEENPYTDLTNLTEAQIQERAMKLAQENQENAAPLPTLEVADTVTPEPAEEIVMSKSADPFEDLSVEAEKAEAGDTIDLKQLASDAPPAAEEPVIPVVKADSFSVKELIAKAEVSTPDKIKKVEGTSNDFDVAYQWNGGSIYGSAEQKRLASPAQFDELVQEYLERTQTRCPGEFAIVPDNTVDSGSLRADSYEIACVGQSVSSGASLLFFNKGDTFTVVAHEAPAEELGEAMNYRNKLMRFITGS